MLRHFVRFFIGPYVKKEQGTETVSVIQMEPQPVPMRLDLEILYESFELIRVVDLPGGRRSAAEVFWIRSQCLFSGSDDHYSLPDRGLRALQMIADVVGP